ncbi:MAG TPA: hypothetical protein VN761_06285 [Candidatus Polarisedimenticolia bacterium]|nr:hypothetical protein [Candidatus Polarisedimenticolia bacterium]
MVTPLTNGMGFTNTLVQPTNLNEVQLADVVEMLITLQTNVEETLPELSLLTSNVTFTATAPAPTPTTQFHGVIQPMTSGPAPLFSPETAPGASTTAPTQPTSFSLTVGTNRFTIDPPTLQALVQLRDDLQRALPVLQALNGTTPTNGAPVTFLNPPATSFFFAPVTNNFFIPLTNQAAFQAPQF